jgi:hypothetical protein
MTMDALLSLLWFLPSLVFGVGTVVTLVAIRRAPDATEDEEGFHYRPRAGLSLDARQPSGADPVPPLGARLA